jgi:hypothetical protein
MSRTIEAIMKHMAASDAKREIALKRTAKFIARWQEGPQTLSGYAPRKLRLVFAPLPLDDRHYA